jgi:hypothetical protein
MPSYSFIYPFVRINPEYKFNEILSGYNYNFSIIEPLINSGFTSVINGLTLISGQTIGLGGNLTEDTYIPNNGFLFSLDSLSASSISATSIAINSTASTNDLLNIYSTGGNKSLVVDVNGSVYNTGGGNISTNTAFGENSLRDNTTGNGNTAYGNNSLINNTTANNNTAIGSSVLRVNSGTTNTGVGYRSLYSNTDGANNTAIGGSAMRLNISGSSNVAIGVTALQNLTTGGSNTAVGYGAGLGITTGSNNTIIGPVSGLSATLANNVIIADGSGNVRFKSDSTGAISVGQTTVKGSGTTSATKALSVQNSAGTELMYMPDNGGLVVGPSLTLGSSAYAVKCIANFEVVNSSNSQFFFCAHATRNFTFGSNSSPSTGTLVISVPRATAPTTGLTNHFSIYGKEASVGNTCLHTRTENGAIVKIYQETTAVTSSTFVENTGNNVKEDSTFDGYTVAQVVKALRNLGILA